jgi:hypothetical protein
MLTLVKNSSVGQLNTNQSKEEENACCPSCGMQHSRYTCQSLCHLRIYFRYISSSLADIVHHFFGFDGDETTKKFEKYMCLGLAVLSGRMTKDLVMEKEHPLLKVLNGGWLDLMDVDLVFICMIFVLHMSCVDTLFKSQLLHP